jgi:endonuclease/exonuclease/phosphatase family metal-dependent hydrolase
MGEGYDSAERSRQIEFLLAQAAEETNPVIMLGDFNTEEWSDDYAALTVDYVDAFRSLHPDALGPTFPDYSTAQSRTNMHFPRWTPPILRIDYVFHDPAITPLEARVWPTSGGSDHRPLFVRLGLPVGD